VKLALFSGGILAGSLLVLAAQAFWLEDVFGDVKRFTECRDLHGALRAMADYYEHRYARPSFQDPDIWD
jgi:hypothetical protein